MQLAALGLIPLVVTSLSALLARAKAAPTLRRVLGLLLFFAVMFAAYPLLPEDLAYRLPALVAVGLNAIGNVVAVDLRACRGWDSLGDYLFDVFTLSSRRLVPQLAVRQSLALTAVRTAALVGAAAGAIALLRRVPDEALPWVAWVYLKLQVTGLLVQALSDVVYVAFLGRAVPPMRFPMLAVNYLDFWGRRYNTYVHGVLLWIARDRLKLGRRPALLITAAFLVSGAVHELLSFLLLREVRGYWMAFWVAQVGLTFASVKLSRVARRLRWGKALEVLFLHATMALSAPLFFAVTDLAINPFGPVTRLPF